MTVSYLCLLLGAAMIASHGWAWLRPASAIPFVRGFHRNHAAGVLLMLIGAAWLEWNLYNEDLSDIERMKPVLLVLFPALGVGACVVVKDFLAARGLAATLMMLAWYVLDRIRWEKPLWRDAVSGWAYVWVAVGFWLTMAPWRIREWTAWLTESEGRFRGAAFIGVAWGAFIMALALTVFR